MRLVIECIDRVGVAQEILSLVVAHGINLEGIELEKQADKGLVYLKTENAAPVIADKLRAQIRQMSGVSAVKEVTYLPQERKNREWQALLEALPCPVLSLDFAGRIEFANQQACKLLLPIYQQNFPKKRQSSCVSLQGVSLNEVMVNLNRTKWYNGFLQQLATPQLQTVQPISQPIQCAEQLWRMDLLPIELWEAAQNRPLGCVVMLQSQQTLQLDFRQFMAQQNSDFNNIIAQSPKMKAVVELAKKFAALNAPLLIQGETGTGKDLFAKACHQFSFRRDQKFIAVNCAGLPQEEAETEMFGHHGNGKEHIGFFEYANGGTVLLDSVAELSLEMQGKLLRFLNDGVFRRVGEAREIQVDVRVICTSQKPLATLVAEGKIREDLYHRLNVLVLDLPPLRERLDDFAPLVARFVEQISQQLGMEKPQYTTAFIQALQRHHWSGNLRELYNAIYRACSLATHRQLAVEDLNLPDNLPNVEAIQFSEQNSLEEMVNRFEAALLRKFYAEFPSTRKLAQRLGVSHTAVANKLRQYGISK